MNFIIAIDIFGKLAYNIVMKTIIGAIVLIITVIVSIILFILVFGADFDYWTFRVLAISAVIFFLASGLVIGGLLIERGINERQ